MFFARNEGLTLETSVIHEMSQTKNMPYQPLLAFFLKEKHSQLAHRKKPFFTKQVFQCMKHSTLPVTQFVVYR